MDEGVFDRNLASDIEKKFVSVIRCSVLAPLLQLVVAASSHHNLRHTVHECLPLLEDAAKVVMMFEVGTMECYSLYRCKLLPLPSYHP